MLVREKIDHIDDQADELRADVPSPNSSTVAHKVSELRSERREPPSVTPIDPAKRPDPVATAEDHKSSPARKSKNPMGVVRAATDRRGRRRLLVRYRRPDHVDRRCLC
jgi:hypothetical protein